MVAAEKLNLEIIVASDHRQAMASLVPDTSIALNFRKPATAAEKVMRFTEKLQEKKSVVEEPFFSAITGVGDRSVYVASLIAEALGIQHNPPAALAAARNKYLMRQKISAAGLQCPDFKIFSTSKNPARLARRIKYPCVLKPVFLSASRGVARADTPEDFVKNFKNIQNLLKNPEVINRAYDDEAKQVLVEDYIPGIEVAVEGMLIDGEFKSLAIFDKPDPLEGPHFVETIYVTPSRLPAYVQREVIHVSHYAALALGLKNGPVHSEVRINDDGAWAVEVAGRSIGGLCSRILQFNDGISLEELILRQAIGNDIQEIQRDRNAAGVLMIPIPRPGVLVEIQGIEEAKAVPGIDDIIITIPSGKHVEPMPQGGQYLGFIFANGEMPEDVEAAIRASFQKLKIDIV